MHCPFFYCHSLTNEPILTNWCNEMLRILKFILKTIFTRQTQKNYLVLCCLNTEKYAGYLVCKQQKFRTFFLFLFRVYTESLKTNLKVNFCREIIKIGKIDETLFQTGFVGINYIFGNNLICNFSSF